MNENVITKEEMTMIVFFTANPFLLLSLTFFTVMKKQRRELHKGNHLHSTFIPEYILPKTNF
jgi:hypothetical protein